MAWTEQTRTGLGTSVRSLDSIPTGPCTLDIPVLWERSLPRALGKAWSSLRYKSHLKPVGEGRSLEVWL